MPESKVMQVENPVLCRIIGRVNRFVIAVEVDGKDYRASTNNTGRLLQFLIEGREAYGVRQTRGRTDFKIFAIKDGGMAAIIDTQLQVRAFEKYLEMGLIPWLQDTRILKRNVRLGDSVLDYLLLHGKAESYLEVKSAVLREDHYAMYPDCPTPRGRRHIKELISHARSGGEAFILFIAALPDVTAFKPYESGDPELCQLLLEAYQAGVKLKTIGMFYRPEDSSIRLYNPDLPVKLS